MHAGGTAAVSAVAPACTPVMEGDAQPGARAWPCLGGTQGFQDASAARSPAAPSFWMRAQMLCGVCAPRNPAPSALQSCVAVARAACPCMLLERGCRLVQA